MCKFNSPDLSVDPIRVCGSSVDSCIKLSKTELCIMISALAKYAESSKVKLTMNFDDVFLYVYKKDFDSHIKSLFNYFKLQKKLFQLLKSYEDK